MVRSCKGVVEIDGDISEIAVDISLIVAVLLKETTVDIEIINHAIQKGEELAIKKKGEQINDEIIGLHYQE